MDRILEKKSKFLSLVLRHKPEQIGLVLDAEGWADIDVLMRCAADHGMQLSCAEISDVVATNDKKRFAISEDGLRIRANQGHSIPVSLNLPEREPPARLCHGTATRFLASIREQGLIAGTRQHVHLSSETATAIEVGTRYGKPVVLTIMAREMHQAGHRFYCSENGVWLTDHVPPEYIVFGDEA